jgi:hypothetical protein
MLKISVLALVSALSLAACGRDGLTDPDDLRTGQFEGQISGTLDGWVEGEALSGSTSQNLHDLIVLTDYEQGIEITLYHAWDEFYEGRFPIGDAVLEDEDIVAYVRLLDTGEWFDSVDGVIDLHDVRGSGIAGTASFRAESEFDSREILDVDVSFVTDYDGGIDFNLSPSFSVRAKPTSR